MYYVKELDDEKSFDGQHQSSSPPLFPFPSSAFLSPTERPPPRVQSSGSLIGENYVNSGRTPENYALGSYSDDDHTTPPSIHSGFQSLSPPPLPPAPDRYLTTTSVASVHSNPNSVFKKGRPPRAPIVLAPTNVNKALPQPNHNRGNSAGELSFLSALTDPFNDDTIRVRPRGRSWDANSYDLSPVDNREAVPTRQEEEDDVEDPLALILQPILDDEPPRSILTSPILQTKSRGVLDDKISNINIANPIESEAETTIIKILEGRERSRLNPTTTSIWPQLSDEAVASIQAHDIEREDDKVESFLQSPCHTPFGKCVGRKRRLGEQNWRNMLTPAQGQAYQQYVRALTEEDERQMSLDVMLYRLATSLRNIHLSGECVDKSIFRCTLPSEGIGHPLEPLPIKLPQSSSDVLANNAAGLFRCQVKDAPHRTMKNLNNSEYQKTQINAMTRIESEGFDDVEVGASQTRKFHGSSRMNLSSVSNLCCCVPTKDWNSLDKQLDPHRLTFLRIVKLVFIYVVFPSVMAATLCFYGLSNPHLTFGYKESTETYPSISWFIIFLGVRQAVTFMLAKVTETFVIDFLGLKTRCLFQVFGKFCSLAILQSKGWPSTLVFWAFFDLCMLTGSSEFANHWLFYQNWIGLFNANNPSGDITSSIWNYRIVITALLLGFIATFKRIASGVYLGGRQYVQYGTKLALLMNEMIIISQVASLARELQGETKGGCSPRGDGEVETATPSNHKNSSKDNDTSASITNKVDNPSGDFDASERYRIRDILDEWEEPVDEEEIGSVSIKGILQFKQALAFLDLSRPFSSSFGLADSRQNCARSAEEIYSLLLLANPESDMLEFQTLLTIFNDCDYSGAIHDTKLRSLIRIFRPQRDGTLNSFGFVRSIDRVYKDLRLLRASIRTSSQLDRDFEAIVAIGFWFIVLCLVLAFWGMDSLLFFLSLASIILVFAFTISSAISKYIEGVMFILLRKPFDIGDRVFINSVDSAEVESALNSWYVEKVTLYYTTVRHGTTNEVATIANSSLAAARVVNSARSHHAIVHVNLQYGAGVPYSKIQLLEEALVSFVEARPREWVKCSKVACSRVEAESGNVEYSIALQHRESWQHIGSIIESKAAVMSFCLEVEKKLGLKHFALPTSVNRKHDLGSSNTVASKSLNSAKRSSDRDAHVFKSSSATNAASLV